MIKCCKCGKVIDDTYLDYEDVVTCLDCKIENYTRCKGSLNSDGKYIIGDRFSR